MWFILAITITHALIPRPDKRTDAMRKSPSRSLLGIGVGEGRTIRAINEFETKGLTMYEFLTATIMFILAACTAAGFYK